MGKFSTTLQSAILCDGEAQPDLPGLAESLRATLAAMGEPTNVVSAVPGFVHIVAARDLWMTVEHLPHPADHDAFTGALGSGFNQQIVPDAAERVARHRSHVLVNVQQGHLPSTPELDGMYATLGMEVPYRTLPDFVHRAETLCLATNAMLAHPGASMVHWTQSNGLFRADRFFTVETMNAPSMPYIHPFLFGGDAVPGFDQVTAGIRTWGAADFVGREIVVAAAPVPWMDQMDGVVAFLQMATTENGYIVPDDDTFGPEGGEFSYRVRHFEADVPGAFLAEPHYRLTLERDDRHGYAAPDFAPTLPVPGGVAEAALELDPNDARDRAEIDRLAHSARLAEGIGGRLNVGRRTDGPKAFADPAGKSPTRAVVPNSPTMDMHEADRPLDPKDPMDRAILERLREREMAEAAAPSETEVAPRTKVASAGRAKSSFGRRKGGFETRH